MGGLTEFPWEQVPVRKLAPEQTITVPCPACGVEVKIVARVFAVKLDGFAGMDEQVEAHFTIEHGGDGVCCSQVMYVRGDR